VNIGVVLPVVGLMKDGLEFPFDFPGEGEPGQGNSRVASPLAESFGFVENMDVPVG
jgi:hypothetical protein